MTATPRPGARATTPAQEREIAAAYAAGVPVADICLAYGISDQVVRRVRDEHGLTARRVGRPRLPRREEATC